MTVLLKLILAHFIGDFALQPKSWVKEKEAKKVKSPKLYLHILLHGALIMLFLWNPNYGLPVLLLVFFHGLIDVIKLYAQTERTKTSWFLIDQFLHILSILAVWKIGFEPNISFAQWLDQPVLWLYITAVFFLSVVAGIIIKILMINWSATLYEANGESLKEAGKYIGILERLLVFAFVVMGQWEGVGFLLTAKSVFRFGDLKESKNRKLTEYILIGTLLSVGIAVATGILVNYIRGIL